MRNGSRNDATIPFLFLLATSAASLLTFADYTNRICHDKSIPFQLCLNEKKLKRNFQFFLSFVRRSCCESQFSVWQYQKSRSATTILFIYVLLLIAHLILLLGRAASLKTLLALVMILPLLLPLSSCSAHFFVFTQKNGNSWAHSGYDSIMKWEKKRKTFLLFQQQQFVMFVVVLLVSFVVYGPN